MKRLTCCVILFTVLFAHAQGRTDYSTINLSKWFTQKSDTLDYSMGTYLNQPALLLQRKIANYKSCSIAYPLGLQFTNGTIEMDIASPTGKNGFVGLAFHIQDANHYETLYFRPGSSGTINAVQYMPKIGPEFNWWNYEADKYQSVATLPESAWFHVKVVVKGNTMAVYLNNNPQPVMQRTDLNGILTTGSVGFWLGNCSQGAYRNLVVVKG